MANTHNWTTIDDYETIPAKFEVEEEIFDDNMAGVPFFHSGNKGDEFTKAVGIILV